MLFVITKKLYFIQRNIKLLNNQKNDFHHRIFIIDIKMDKYHKDFYEKNKKIKCLCK